METTRLILFIALGLVLTMIWQAWQEDYGPAANQHAQTTENVVVPEAKAPEDLPGIEHVVENKTTESFSPLDIDKPVYSEGTIINVKTDVLDIQINTEGGTIQRLALLEYPVSKKRPNEPVILLRDEPGDFYIVQGGLLSKNETANHKSLFQTEKTEYTLGSDDE